MADLNALADTLVNLTVKEVSELATILEEVHGIKPAAAAVVAGPGGAGGGGEEEAAQTEFDVILTSAGSGKLKVVKELKGLLGLGLKDAKGLVDSAPVAVKEKVSQDEANALKETLEGLGASIEIK